MANQTQPTKYYQPNRDDHKYTGAEIVSIIGSVGLDRLHGTNCEPTNRLLPDCDDRCEWSALIEATGPDGDNLLISAIYYTTPDDDQIVEDNGGDWGGINWVVDHYTILTR
ncbi:MAG TPA: hypothetical protein V6D12_14090 [Candidatus Obscuribacterales bacterium]